MSGVKTHSPHGPICGRMGVVKTHSPHGPICGRMSGARYSQIDLSHISLGTITRIKGRK
ncbi:hypothetical protein Hanom_Chr08g00723131 [Helianthus anomalus]